MKMDKIICELKGFNGKIGLYNNKIVISHHKKQQLEILLDQIGQVQFKRGDMEQGFIQLTVVGKEKFYNNLKDITNDESSITFGYPKNDEAEQFKYQLGKLIPDKPINILQKVKDIQQFNPKTPNEVISTSITENIKESGEAACKKQNEFKETVEMNSVCCPKCHSTSIQANARGYSPLSGIFGALFLGFIGSLLGPIGTIIGVIIGILCGFSGSKKVRITCLKCGHKFYPGKR